MHSPFPPKLASSNSAQISINTFHCTVHNICAVTSKWFLLTLLQQPEYLDNISSTKCKPFAVNMPDQPQLQCNNHLGI